MKTRVQRWGNSLAVRIPKAYAAEIGLSDESPVELKVNRGVLVVEPSASAPRLGDLLRGISEANLHKEVHTGPAVGNEAW
ncbi:MAG: AbrB/MazE/SpoVT family DNA-binding domain-containing protein [Anaerolineales bacterium]|jgi:antitoxin MazE|nr:AbrB/MazE/SpoVT family DNA-binding domain-containing protein [Anaerolineales bacterium]